MSISLNRYVDITSNLAGAGAAVTRKLVARIFDANIKIPPTKFLEFTNASDVGTYFGFVSEEYYRAQFYFSWVSKEATFPQAIQYASWNNTASAPYIYSVPAPLQTFTLAHWTAVNDGAFTLTMGGFTFTMSSLDFTAAASGADVASIIQGAIQAQSGGGALWTSATVSFVTPGFFLTGGATGAAAISVSHVIAGTDISVVGFLGWTPGEPQSEIFDVTTYNTNALWIPGGAIQTLTACLTASAALSDDFGSFAFMYNLGLNTTQLTEIATWNNAENVKYLYSVGVTAAARNAVHAALNALQGTALTLEETAIVRQGTVVSASANIVDLFDTSDLYVGMPVSGTNIPAGSFIIAILSATSVQIQNNATGSATEDVTFGAGQYPEMFPMMIEAATNYDGVNTVQNYMYQQVAGLTPLVTTDSNANLFDALAINYYGQTQTAGNQISFYQRGLLQGSAVVTNITDMTAYVNEIWLKDAISVAIINLLLSLTQLPANNQGRIQLLAIIQSIINQALTNGVISVDKTLSANQIAFIIANTGDPKAWYQVQNSGYWIDVVISPIPNVLPTQYQATYTLIYSKDDVIRLVNGQDFLI